RKFINSVAEASRAPRLVELSSPVVEAGVFESTAGDALVLGNFTYQPISQLAIGLPVKNTPKRVRSLEKGPLKFTTERASKELSAQGYSRVAHCTVPLGLNDIVLFE